MDLSTNSLLELSTYVAQVCDFLEAHQMSYALTGGLALSIWGFPRSTIDIDMVLDIQPSVAELFWKNHVHNMPFLLEPDEVTFPHMKLYRGIIRTDADSADCIMVDMLIVDPIWTAELIGRRVAVQLMDKIIWVCSAEDVILLKLFSPRSRDHDDIKQMIQLRNSRLDHAYLAKWSKQLGTESRWIQMTW